MTNIEIKVKTGEQSLEIDDFKVYLHPSLVKAEFSTLPQGIGGKVLELMYEENKEDFIFEEFDKVYSFLEKKDLTRHLEAYPCPEGKELSTIAITGNFKAYIFE